METVEQSWTTGEPIADPLQRFDAKLRRLARDLKRWSQQRVGNIRDQLLVATEVILRLDIAQESRPLMTVEQNIRRGLKKQVLGLASLERTMARQRARMVGLRDGDANVQFFRINASKRRRRIALTGLRSGDAVAQSQEEMEELATNFFVQLLGRP